MPEEDTGGRVTESEISSIVKPERLRTAALAAVSLLPWIGGTLARILDEELPSRRWERLKDFLGRLHSRLNVLERQLNEDVVKKGDVIEIVEEAMIQSARTESESKHRAFAGLVAAALTRDPDWEEMRFFLSKVSTFSPLHLRLLMFLESPERELRRESRDPDTIHGNSIGEVLQVAFVGVDQEMVRSVWADLFSQGFLNTEARTLGTMLASSGVAAVRGRLTGIGQRFAEFLATGEEAE